MAKIVGMPRLSPTMEEATLSRWVKQEGDEIALDDVIAEVETDKATMEWRSFDVGVLLKTLAPEGATLQPDAPIAIIGQRGEDYSHLMPGAQRAPDAIAAQKTGAAAPGAEREEPEKRVEESREEPAPSTDTRMIASPSVRRLARQHSLELQGVRGTGPHGRVIQRDIEQLLEASARVEAQDHKTGDSAPVDGRTQPKVEKAAPERDSQHEGHGERGRTARAVPLSATRRTIARRLTEAKQTIPHFYLNVEVNAEPLLGAREELNRSLAEQGEKISLNDLVIRACASALRQVPAVNASFTGDSITYHDAVDICVAVAVPDGLVTPVVRNADAKGLRTIAREVRDLASRAQDKQLAPEEMAGGTFSISNLGMYGIDDFAAVINPPQAAILAVGAIRSEPIVRDGSLAVGNRMRVTLSCDHRVIDGAVGATWLKAFRAVVENPLQLLL